MDGKRHWIQGLAPALLAVLLALSFLQRQELKRLRQDVWNLQNELSRQVSILENQVRGVSADLMEGERMVLEWEAAPAGVVLEERRLNMAFSMKLKDWCEDTEVRLAVVQSRDTQYVALSGNGVGGFSGSFQLDLSAGALSEPLELAVQRRNGEAWQQEALNTYYDISQLLPVRFGGGGSATGTYTNGTILLHDGFVSLYSEDGPAAIKEPLFSILVNGRTVRREAGTQREHDAYEWTLPEKVECAIACQPGDTVELAFICRDVSGLGYQFTLGSWQITEAGKAEERALPENGGLALLWE